MSTQPPSQDSPQDHPDVAAPELDLPVAAVEAFNQANADFKAGRWEQARAGYALALQQAPQMEAAALQWARCGVLLGDWQAAREGFATLLKAFPANYSGWLEAGHLCRQQGVPQQAMTCYSKAIALVPTRYEARLSLARVLEDQGQMDAGAAEYHRALTVAGVDKNRLVHWRMGKFRLERGDAARALESLRQALLVLRVSQEQIDDNERAEMQMDLGDIFMRLGMTEDGHRAFERASAGTAEATLVRLADLSFRYNLWQEAQAVLRRNVELHPDSGTAHWNLAHSLAESWNMQEALASLAKAEAIAPQPGAK